MTHQVALSSVLSMVARVERLDQNSLLHGQGSAFAGRLCAVRKWCAHSLVVTASTSLDVGVLRGGESRCRYGELIDAGRK